MKVNKYDQIKSELLLIPDDPWIGLATETPQPGLTTSSKLHQNHSVLKRNSINPT
jgi:hypothetical protein